eukprot:Sspe_Gene.42061::Locus_20407_Transcript_1_1_Confidence_1.000_Length_4089::g.42061::m.42061/K10408/DNAH; dynein heavy chain, axonemal
MSFLDKEIADLVAPVPEEFLEGKSGRQKVEAEKGYRACVRLQAQEEHLSRQAYLKTATSEQLVPKPPRRIPQPQTAQTVKIHIPKTLHDLVHQERTARNGKKVQKQTRSPSGEKATPEAVADPASPENVQQQQEEPVVGPSSIDTLQMKTLKRDTLTVPPSKINPRSPTETIGSLYTPTANIRSITRNQRMTPHEYTKSYRNTQPPPPPEPDLVPTLKGKLGVDPQQSHFLPLEEFDNSELGPPCEPQDWILMGQMGVDAMGTPAKSKYYFDDNQGEDWTPCRVLEYDEEEDSYLIQWVKEDGSRGKTKWVKRLNLIFDAEDVDQWKERYRQAWELRNQAEAQMRLYLYVNGMPDDVVTPIDEDQVDRILALVADEFPLAQLHVIEKSIAEMRQMYSYGMKQAVFNYRFLDPKEKKRLEALSLPQELPPPMPELNKLMGTIDTPSPNFVYSRHYIEENLFFTHHLLYKTIFTIVGRWSLFAPQLLCDVEMKGVPLPCELETFKMKQSTRVCKVSEKLQDDWSVNTTATILNDLDYHFNFYEDDPERYRNSRMCRFFRMINLIMAHQMRSLILDSIRTYTDFLLQFQVVYDENFNEDDDWLEDEPEEKAERERKIAFLEERERIEAERKAAEAEKAAAETKPKKKQQQLDEEEPEEVEEEAPADVCLIRLSLEIDEEKEHRGFSKRILKMCQEVNGNQPLFVIKLISNTDAVMFDPLLEEVEDAVKSVYEGFFNETQDILGVGDKLFPLLNLRPFELQSVARSELPVDQVHQLMTENKKGPRQLLALYESFEYLLKVDIDSYIEEFEATNPTREDFAAQLDQLARDIDRIQKRSLNEVCFEMIKVECYDIKRSLTRKAQEISSALSQLLAKQARERCLRCSEQYTEMYEAIQAKVETPEALHKLKLEADKVPAKIEELQEVFATVTDAHHLLAKHQSPVEEEDFVLYWRTYEWPKRVQQVLEDSEFRYKECRHRFINQLREDTENLTRELQELQTQVDKCSRWHSDANVEEYFMQVQKLRQQIDECEKMMKIYNSRENLFNMPNTPWHLKELNQSFEPYEQLWTMVNHVNSKFELWYMRPFENLMPEEVEMNVMQWGKTLNALTRKLKDEGPQSIAQKFFDQVKFFQPLLPLITALRHPGLQAKHWKEIAAMVGKTDKDLKPAEPDKFTLRHLTTFDLLSHLSEIEEVSDRAEKQHKLDKQLADMKAEWTHVQYQLEPHGDTFVLKEVDDIQAKLDEHIVKTQTMLGSQHAKDIKDQVERWEKRLLLLQRIQDEWLKCQQSWAYLEPIFLASDIQKALPGAFQSFSKVDKVWCEVMESTKKNPNVLIKADDEDLLRKFQKANGLLE